MLIGLEFGDVQAVGLEGGEVGLFYHGLTGLFDFSLNV